MLHRFTLARQAFSDSLSRPTAAPARWPYVEHRTVGHAVRDLAWEQSRVAAVRETAVFHDKPTSGIEA